MKVLIITICLLYTTGLCNFFLFSNGYVNSSIWKMFKPNQEIDLYLIENFEERVPWEIHNKRAIPVQFSFIKKQPFKKNTQDPYFQELNSLYLTDIEFIQTSAQIHKRNLPKKSTLALEMSTYFSNPGTDAIFIGPSQPIKIYALARVFAIWVKSHYTKHRIFAVFEDIYKKQHYLPLRTLDYWDWERLEIPLPGFLQKANRRNQNQYEVYFKGLLVKSHPKEKPGLFLIAIDLPMLMLDRSYDLKYRKW